MGMYVLLAGSHFDAVKGQDYKFDKDKSVVVISDEPLDEMHANKFRKLEMPAYLTTEAPMTDEFDGRPASVIDSYTPPVRPVTPEAKVVGMEKKTVKTEPPKPVGEDVTEDFPSAVTHNLRVMRHKGEYFVTQEADPDTLLHTKRLNKKSLVTKCIDQWTETHPTDVEEEDEG